MMPGAAMRNIRKSLKPGGELTMVVWRRREENPWLYEAELRVRELVPVVAHEDTDQVHCGPGPFSMAGPDMVSMMLVSAGYDRIAFERFDADICIGRDMAEAIEFAMALGPAGEIIRLAGDEGEKRRDAVVAALREALAPYARERRRVGAVVDLVRHRAQSMTIAGGGRRDLRRGSRLRGPATSTSPSPPSCGA